MAPVLKTLRAMSRIGILAERDGGMPHVEFRRYNLLYGFNGSGKSTLSRMLASLQAGTRDPRLPPTSTFEFELDDGSLLACPDNLNRLERRVLVFNTDFIEQNLQWSNRRANPVFYIGKQQATLADELAETRVRLSSSEVQVMRAADALKAAERGITTFKRDHARLIADRLRLPGRRYEAPQLSTDYDELQLDERSQLTDDALQAFSDTCAREHPFPPIGEISLPLDAATDILSAPRDVCGMAPSAAALRELATHPQMLVWVMEGHEYHKAHDLKECLFCNGPLSTERMQAIQKALDGGIDSIVSIINTARTDVESLNEALAAMDAPATPLLSAPYVAPYQDALKAFEKVLGSLKQTLTTAIGLLTKKGQAPSVILDSFGLPDRRHAGQLVGALRDAQTRLNTVIAAHNKDVGDFARLQDDARLAIRKHYLFEGLSEYDTLDRAIVETNAESRARIAAEAELTARILSLENQIREHGPAAEAINRLLHSYLGHPELSVAAVKNGYEIHRNERLITGLPSEGEKTAIALCYFLSMLESEGRKTRELIIVIDDPISSLDSRSLNFACSLIISRLSESAQLFVLTHNQNCLNEFRKPWKSKARAEESKGPTAAFLFLDVSMPVGSQRISNIIELPRLLREYDSEYHYLCHHVLKFAAAQAEYDHAYMMPNVLRRVLELFLAFRCPGNSGLPSKIAQLCKAHSALDYDRIIALERLSQMESHSDNLDDLISFSSMTIEETKDATNALLTLMQQVDPEHLRGLRRICS
jgi:wobble nucleotide-excising tRNase